MEKPSYQIYYAHSAENLPESQWQTQLSHARNVGEMAMRFVFFFDVQEIARYQTVSYMIWAKKSPSLYGGGVLDGSREES